MFLNYRASDDYLLMIWPSLKSLLPFSQMCEMCFSWNLEAFEMAVLITVLLFCYYASLISGSPPGGSPCDDIDSITVSIAINL